MWKLTKIPDEGQGDNDANSSGTNSEPENPIDVTGNL